ncbi:death domain-containing protein 1-like isoform X2 [Patiria miniata]|uniref:Death domain-containing protein n=1 Tax=Patiria miniata TaxID=46514 RepID=A0A914BP44_PATMI|nr:death domain-containing protein 1-like isoform X2 [Patiria miniata]
MSDVGEAKPSRCRHSHGEEDESTSRKTDQSKGVRKPSKTPSQASSVRFNNSQKDPGSQVSVPLSHSDRRSSGTSEVASVTTKDSINEASEPENLSIDDEAAERASLRSSGSTRSVSGNLTSERAPSVDYSTDLDLSQSASSLRGGSDNRSMGGVSDLSKRSAPSEVSGKSLKASKSASEKYEPSENGTSEVSKDPEVTADEVPRGETNTAAVFTSFIQALREETQRLENTENLRKFESSHVRGILGELTDTLRDSEDQSLRLYEGIEAIREAAQGLKRTLEARLNRSTDAEAEVMMEGQENTDNKKAHSRAVAAVSAAKALLAEVALDVTEAAKMAAEAETAAAEAAAAAEEVVEEIGEIEDRLDEVEDGEVEEQEEEEKEIPVGEDAGRQKDEEDREASDDDDDAGQSGEDAHSHTSSRLEDDNEDLQTKEDGESDREDEDREEDVAQEETEKTDERKAETPKPPESPKRRRSIKDNVMEWPYHILNLPDDDVTDDEIGCVVRYKAEYFTSSSPDFCCVVNNHMSVDAVGDSEELVSHVVSVEHVEDSPGGELEAPIVVAVPYGVSPRMMSTREFVVKFKSGNEDEWKVVPMLATDSSFAEHKGPFAEVRTNQLGSFAVIARLIKDRQTITKKGGVVKSSSDHRMNVAYPPGVCSLMSVTLQVQPAEQAVSDLRARMRHCSDLIAASPIITLTHSSNKPFEKPVTVTIPCPPNPLKVPAAGGVSSANSPSKPAEKQAPLSPDGAVIIRGTKSSIFGGDPANDTLHLMHRQSNWNYWNEVENAQFKQVRKDLVSIELDRPMDKLLILRMTSDGRYPAKNVAQTFERALQIKYASIILHHRVDDPQRVVVQCVPARQLDSALRRLSQDGYEGPPDPSVDVPMSEGQEITLKFSGNIKIVGRDQITFTFHSHRRNMVEFLIEETNKFGNHSSDEYRGMAEFYGTPRITLADMEDPEEVLLREAEAKAAEKENKRSGASMLTKAEKKKQEGLDGGGRDYQSLRKVESDLICKLSVLLPKAEPDPPLPPSRYRATAIDAGGFVSNANLRWLSSELGNEWESLATVLGIKRSRLQSIKRNNPIKVEHQVLDMLVTWRSMLPRAYDKERKLCRALVRCGRYDLAEELKERDASNTEINHIAHNNNLNVLDMDEY